MKPEEQQQALKDIAAEIAACTACPLYEGTTNPVPGSGAMNADIMFIGEGPGQSEDKQGLPFVGRSGKYLDKLLNGIGLSRSEVFITNVVKHRPPENRDPTSAEIEACRHYLDRQIEVINPVLIATLGRFSMARYFPKGKITKIHGQPKYEGGRIYYPLFHPAAALRNPNLQPVMEEDFARMKDLIAEVKSGQINLEDTGENGGGDPPEQLTMF